MRRAWVTEAVRRVLIEAAQRSAPYETGGILIGVLRDSNPWVVMAVEVEDPSRGRSRFVIPEGVTPAVVEIARQIDNRFGYVGDWHSHPVDLPASSTDKGTLARSARRRRTDVQPILLIVVRAARDGWSVEALCDPGAGPEAIELCLTGGLPPLEPSDDIGADDVTASPQPADQRAMPPDAGPRDRPQTGSRNGGPCRGSRARGSAGG
jgi:proteasome lid subunit RPN8/RPN11